MGSINDSVPKFISFVLIDTACPLPQSLLHFYLNKINDFPKFSPAKAVFYIVNIFETIRGTKNSITSTGNEEDFL